jgi:hypothetical protein
MELLKKMELALLDQWQKLQLEANPHLRTLAIAAYYVEFRAYQLQKKHVEKLNLPIGAT